MLVRCRNVIVRSLSFSSHPNSTSGWSKLVILPSFAANISSVLRTGLADEYQSLTTSCPPHAVTTYPYLIMHPRPPSCSASALSLPGSSPSADGGSVCQCAPGNTRGGTEFAAVFGDFSSW